MTYVVRCVAVTALFCAVLPKTIVAQDQRHPRWEIPGFDFRRDGVWRKKAREVRAMRARLRAAGRFAELAAPIGSAPMMSPSGGPSASATQVSGVLRVPAILFRFKDSPAPSFVAADYDAVLFGATPPAGRPYTYRSFYQQLSNGVFDIQGQTYGYANLDSNEVYYTAGTSLSCQQDNPYQSTNCNGLFSPTAQVRMQSALTQALAKLDAQIDFSQYVDPTSGYVPLVLFMHEAVGGECGPQSAPQNHLWAHRFALFTDYQTQDNWPGHGTTKIRISDYILQPSVGGSTSCDASQIMPIGTVAHETGHGFGLPDLYDTQSSSEGIGEWGLMGSGNFTSPLSPSRMDAWSLNQLGWITLAPLTTNGTYSFDAAPLSDTAFIVTVPAPNPRNEYFLLENRQRQHSDSAMLRIHCLRWGSPASCPGGLLIWHVDGVKMNQGGNALNSGFPHGLELVQGDAFGNLDANSSNACATGSIVANCSDRGDAGDLYPGASGNTAFIYRTNPASLRNSDASFTGIAVDSIQQLIPDRTMSFRLRFGGLTVVRGSDSTSTIQFDGTPYKVFRNLLDQGSSHTVGFTSGQVSVDGRTRWFFSSWSDGLAMSHSISGNLAGDTLIATLARQFKLAASANAGGTVTADTAINLAAGDFIPDGRAVQLTPSNGGTGLNFCGWTGDSTTTDSVISVGMHHPYGLIADFGTPATISSDSIRPDGIMGAAYSDQLQVTGGGSIKNWIRVAGALPAGVTLSTSGQLVGFPQQTGTFRYTAQVNSCGTQAKAFKFTVTAPTLATSDVVAQLLGPTAPLTPDQIRYLDFLGNNNNGFDIGDFLAWVKATNAPLSAAVLQALQRKGGRP